MTNNKIKNIYNSIHNSIGFKVPNNANEFVDLFKRDKSKYLFIEDKLLSICEILDEEKMLAKFKNDNSFYAYIEDLGFNITENDYDSFCIYSDIRSLKLLGIDKYEVIALITSKYPSC